MVGRPREEGFVDSGRAGRGARESRSGGGGTAARARAEPLDEQRLQRGLQRPGGDRGDLDVEVARDALRPELQAGDLREVLRAGADLRVLRGAAVVLEAVARVLRVAAPRVVAPVDAEAAEGHPHDGAPLAGHLEAGLEGGGRVVHGTAGALRALRAECNLEAPVLGRGRLHLQEKGAVDEAARVGEVRRGEDEAALRADLAEARRLEEGHDRAGALEVPLRALHRERGVRPPAHHGVVHGPPAERGAFGVVERGKGHVLPALVAHGGGRTPGVQQLLHLEPRLVPRFRRELAHDLRARPRAIRMPRGSGQQGEGRE
eukprot:CAMPEP_0175690542 /NCGR_PEP_ID=MMETSP0097-20121207/29946_1 /TAXON_ID=311494 /ORGANISM="Alexandrium monilatum, Strain CCMP3105" /LENGTH=316 /DNA_ID=CAMNT_0016997585 /DNA_START=18 /DNA_END=969 /DNA_ORIENTATION=-